MTEVATTPQSLIPVLVQIILALGIAVGLITVSHIFGQRPRKKSPVKDEAYECGLPMPGNPHPRFGVKFYLTAMLFIVFDIEVVFMFPLAIVYRDLVASGVSILFPVLAFIAVLAVGLVYEIRKGALEWDR
jgi:NADH-quinone oxidoreductase subunit A